jgi:hypothetical protein
MRSCATSAAPLPSLSVSLFGILPHASSSTRELDELLSRDKANLDITWLRDESLEDLDNLPAPR